MWEGANHDFEYGFSAGVKVPLTNTDNQTEDIHKLEIGGSEDRVIGESGHRVIGKSGHRNQHE